MAPLPHIGMPVVDHPTKDALVERDDGVVRQVGQFGPVNRLAAFREGSNPLDDRVLGDEQRHVAVDAAFPNAVGIHRLFGVPVRHPDFVPQEPGTLFLGMGDACLLQRQVQLQG
jgi:hypothetical protein